VQAENDTTRRLEALIQAGVTLASELSLPAVLQKITDLACDVADARYGALGVVGADGKIGEFITHGVSEEERARIGHLPEGHGILGVLIDETQPLRLRRIQDHPKSYGFPANHPSMTSFLGVPIEVRGHVFGNLYLTEKIGEDEFTEDDERAVVTLATQAGIAIENARLYTAATGNQLRLAAVNQVTEAILEGRPTTEVLRLIARYARELVGADLSTIATPEPDGVHLSICVAEGAEADRLDGVRFPMEGSLSAEVVGSGRAIMIEDVSEAASPDQPVVRLGTIGPAMLVPLGVKGNAFGTLAVGNVLGRASFTSDDLALVRMFASQAGVALEYARVRAELERVAIVEDRERIAKELHDGVVQSLFAVGMALQATESMADDTPEVRKRLVSAVEDIDGAIRDLRNYIFALRPGELADWQLIRILREVAADLGDSAGITIEVEIDPRAAARLASKAFDIIQSAREALSNAVRHSGATRISLTLTEQDDVATLDISDDGRGFDTSVPSSGHGLSNLRARAEAIGGSITITSGAAGTTVRIAVQL